MGLLLDFSFPIMPPMTWRRGRLLIAFCVAPFLWAVPPACSRRQTPVPNLDALKETLKKEMKTLPTLSDSPTSNVVRTVE